MLFRSRMTCCQWPRSSFLASGRKRETESSQVLQQFPFGHVGGLAAQRAHRQFTGNALPEGVGQIAGFELRLAPGQEPVTLHRNHRFEGDPGILGAGGVGPEDRAD